MAARQHSPNLRPGESMIANIKAASARKVDELLKERSARVTSPIDKKPTQMVKLHSIAQSIEGLLDEKLQTEEEDARIRVNREIELADLAESDQSGATLLNFSNFDQDLENINTRLHHAETLDNAVAMNSRESEHKLLTILKQHKIEQMNYTF